MSLRQRSKSLRGGRCQCAILNLLFFLVCIMLGCDHINRPEMKDVFGSPSLARSSIIQHTQTHTHKRTRSGCRPRCACVCLAFECLCSNLLNPHTHTPPPRCASTDDAWHRIAGIVGPDIGPVAKSFDTQIYICKLRGTFDFDSDVIIPFP